MDAAAELGRNPVSRFSLSMEMSRLTRDGTAEPVSRDQILRHARGQGNVHFPCSADHEQDWQPYPVDPYSAICDDHTYIHTYILLLKGTYEATVHHAISIIIIRLSNALQRFLAAVRTNIYKILHVISYKLFRWFCNIFCLKVCAVNSQCTTEWRQ